MRLSTLDDTSSRSNYSKLALVFVIILGVVTFKGVDSTVAISAARSTSDPTLSKQLNSLGSFIALREGARPPLIYAKSYILLDSTSTETISSKDPLTKLPIASTTKMTTALVTLQNFSLDDVITVSKNATLVSGSVIGLEAGEKVTVQSLLKGLLIHSGNDAAFALADAYSKEDGNETKFVEAMNTYVKAENINNTSFIDPAGLNDNGGSTAFDLANIARLLLAKPELAKIVTTPEETLTSVDGVIQHPLKNTNRLIETDNPYYLPSALGVKTGYTPAAGHCLVGAYKWNERILIGVVMNTNESTNIASAQEMNKLFRWADASLVEKSY